MLLMWSLVMFLKLHTLWCIFAAIYVTIHVMIVGIYVLYWFLVYNISIISHASSVVTFALTLSLIHCVHFSCRCPPSYTLSGFLFYF